MTAPIVLETDRHLKWSAFDVLEKGLMILCGLCLTAFTVSTLIDVITREIGHPLLWLQEVTSTFFIYGVFVGTAVAVRRNDHLFLSALTEKMSGSPVLRSLQPNGRTAGRRRHGLVRLAECADRTG
jgi:Tripartite ATP-independent periplasmic transporters, DctQ component